MAQSMVVFDTDRIKEYIFATGRLAEIRGASRLLEELNRSQTRQVIVDIVPDADIVYHNGGSALVLVPNSEAQAIINAVEALYRRKTLTATISGVNIRYEPNQPFGDQVREAFALLRRVKDEKEVEPHVFVSPWLRICDACGQYPASHTDSSDLICGACHIKRVQGTEQRGIFWQDFLEAERISDNCWRDNQFPRDLDDIGAVSKPPGYVGFLYADANSMGKILGKLQTQNDYASFASKVDWLTREVVHQALRKYARPRSIGERQVAPFEILLMGGDDLMLITAADLAIDIALEIVRSYEYRARTETGHELTLSLGLVLAHARFPIRAMYDLASDLLKSAKRVGGSALDFTVVTAAGSRNLAWLRDEVLTEKSFQVRPPEGWRYRLTQRPYRLTDFRKLCDHARQLKTVRFPLSRLQALYEGLFVSGVEASLRTITAMGRASSHHKSRLQAFLTDFGSLPNIAPPWQRSETRENIFTTALGDLVELYRFVTVPERGEEDAGND